jgi:hypothetical protein
VVVVVVCTDVLDSVIVLVDTEVVGVTVLESVVVCVVDALFSICGKMT